MPSRGPRSAGIGWPPRRPDPPPGSHPAAIQEREKALRTNPPKPSDRAFPALIIARDEAPEGVPARWRARRSYEDRLALCAAVIVDPGDAIIPPSCARQRKTRAAHGDLGDRRFAIVLTNDFVIEPFRACRRKRPTPPRRRRARRRLIHGLVTCKPHARRLGQRRCVVLHLPRHRATWSAVSRSTSPATAGSARSPSRSDEPRRYDVVRHALDERALLLGRVRGSFADFADEGL